LEEQARELDETGKIILSTINKKITKISTVEKEKEGSKQTIPLNQSNTEIKNEIRKSKFWKNSTGNLESLTHNFAISH
jgi:myo-inositol-1-phosphate synthase